MKSAVLARASGAARVVGFSIWHLREKAARPFYSDAPRSPRRRAHVIQRTCACCAPLGVDDERIGFPLADVDSPCAARGARSESGGDRVRADQSGRGVAEQAVAARALRRAGGVPARRRGICARSCCGDRAKKAWRARSPRPRPARRASRRRRAGRPGRARARRGADGVGRHRARCTSRRPSGTPIVALFGPTDPDRNGPWSPDDVVVSRYEACGCHYERRCQPAVRWCLGELPVAEVTAAVQQRLGSVRAGGRGAE